MWKKITMHEHYSLHSLRLLLCPAADLPDKLGLLNLERALYKKHRNLSTNIDVSFKTEIHYYWLLKSLNCVFSAVIDGMKKKIKNKTNILNCIKFKIMESDSLNFL